MAITVASLRASFTSDTADLEQGVARAARASDKAAGDIRAAGARSEGAFDGLSAKAVALGGVLSSAITGGLGLAISGFQSAISAGASFGETLNRIQAVGGASADQLAVINQKALELGAKLPISAQEGADGMLALVSGGMSVEQALSAVEGVAGFAAAQMLDVGSAAEIVSGSLTSFGLGADQASFAADVMSQVANSSAASVQDWGESIKYVGPVAGALKQPIEDMGVAIGLMANQSIKGSSAGTALRTMLTNLAAPSKEVATSLASMGVQTTNAAGQMLPFISIAEQMRSKMAAMTDVQKAQIAETIAGKEGMSGFLAIVNAAPGDFDKMKQSMASAQGATEEFAKATNKGFAFEWGQLQGSIETVLIQGFQAVEPVLSSLTGVATGFVNAIGGGLASVAPMLQGLGASIQSVITGFQAGGLAGGAASIAASLGFGPEVQGQVQAVMQGVQNAVAAGVAGLQSVVSGVATAIGPILGSAFQTAGAIAQSVLGGLPSLFQAIQGPAQSIAASVGGVLSSAFQAVGQIAQSVFGALPGYISIGTSVLSSLASFVGSTLAAAFQVIGPIAQSVFSGIATVVQTAMPGVMSLASAVGSLLVAAFNALQAIAVSVFNAIQPYIPAVQAAIGSLASAVGGTLNTAFQAAANFVTGTVVPALTNLGAWLADNLPGAIQALANFWTGTLQPAIASVAGWITGTLFPALGELFGWLQAQLPGALQALANFWTGTLQPAIVQVAGWVTGTLFPMFGELVNWLSSTLTGALQTLSDFWGQHGDTILTIAQNTWEAIQSVIDAVLGTITGLWQAFQSAREGDWAGFGEKLRAIWDASWEAIKNVILAAWPVIVQTAANIVTGIQETFTSIDWGAVGTAVVQGIADGISAGIDFITDAARNVAEAALDAAKAFLGIASPSAVMADEVGRPMAEGIAEGFLEALQGGGLAQIVGGVRGVLAELATVLKGIGGVFSNSDLEKFRDGIGALADALASIAGISGIFGGETMPSLTGLVDLIRQLAIDARAVLAELDIVVPVIGETLAARLKALGEAASGAKSVAENAFGLIRVLADTLAFDFGVVDWSTAYHNLIGLARAALIYVQALDPVTLVVSDALIAKLRSLGDGVGAVKAIAENTFGLIKVLVDTLAFDFAAPDWSRAWHNLMGLMQAAITYADAALRLADTFTGVVSGAATELGKALQLTVGIIQNAFDMLTFLEDVEVPLTPFLYLLVKLAQVIPLASRVSEAFLLIASQFSGIVTVAATELGKALALAVGTIRDALVVITGLAEADISAWVVIPLLSFMVKIGQIIPLASNIASMVTELASRFTGQVTPAAEELGRALSSSLGILTGSLKLISFFTEDLAEGPDPNAIDRSTIKAVLTSLLKFGIEVAQTAVTVVGNLRLVVKPALDAVGQALAGTFDALSGALDVAALLTSDDLIDTRGLADQVKSKLVALLKFGISIAQTANAVIGNLKLVVKPALDALGATLSSTFDALSGALDVATLLTDDELPDIKGLAALVKPKITAILKFGIEVAQAANAVIGNLKIAVKPALDALGATLSSTFDALSGALDIASLLTGDELPETKGLTALVRTRLTGILRFGIEVAQTANAVIGNLKIVVKPALDALGTTLSNVFDALSGSLDIAALMTGDKLPDVKELGPLVKMRLASLLKFGIDIAQAANAVIGNLKIVVKPALANLGTVLGDTLGVIKEVLDFSELTDEIASFRGFDMSVIGPKLALIFSAAVAIAKEFGRRASTSGIKEAWVEAGAALSSLFGDAASTLKDALDLGAALLDPETQIPSIGQIQGKVDALFNIIQGVAAQFAARASAAANAGMNFEQVGSFAETVKAVFEGIREVAAAIADFTGVSLGASGFNNIAQVLNAVFTLFEQVAGRASVVNQVSAAIASVLGGLAALVDAQAYQAGVDIGTRIADGIAAGLRNGLENLNPMPGGGDDKNKGTTPNAGGGGGGNVIYIYNIDNSKNITISQVINTTPENVGKAAGGWYPLLAGY